MKPLLYLLLATLLIGYVSLSCVGGSKSDMNILIPYWTRSYELYKQPHALWLDRYEKVGENLPKLKYLLEKAENARRTPEIVLYAIPLRDLGQSSDGGFDTYELYWQDNLLNAEQIKGFVERTGIRPRLYLEPDSVPLAVQYRQDEGFSAESVKIYNERMSVMHRLIDLYHDAGALVYLEAGHSGWFDYGDDNIQRIAQALNEAGIAKADGLASNVSNRQPVYQVDWDRSGRNEWHYFSRLLPLLRNKKLDVVVDTSRSGGTTTPRIYYLQPGGQLIDNEKSTGRLVGRWRKVKRETKEGVPFEDILLEPFFGVKGKPKWLSRLTGKEKYTYDKEKRLLAAPAWLDPIGDVKLGPPPSDHPPGLVGELIHRYRYIKPPDECDGSLNCPPGLSKHDIREETEKRQPTEGLALSPGIFR